ncbi:hypothetical protein HZS_5642 [Henneguya salminicola]|nr:hypothetical protein HZS_5642 [Henneguya salminicola]
MIVQLDQSLFSKKKYHTGGRSAKLQWSSPLYDFSYVESRDAATFVSITQKYILPETEIYNDREKSCESFKGIQSPLGNRYISYRGDVDHYSKKTSCQRYV